MSRYEGRKRDGLARIGIFEHEGVTLTLPAAVDADGLFPNLQRRALSNVPLDAGPAFAARYHEPGSDQPASVHPAAPAAAASGDCVMAAGWHTALANPRKYVEWLVALKERVVPDTAWYAPAAALPRAAALLVYTGFDLFDYRAVDLATARGVFCTPEGEFPASMMESGVCGCAGCRDGDLKRHNRQALEREIALVARFVEAGQLRELVESRCRLDAAQVGILRFLDRQYAFLERRLPIARDVTLRANSAESQNRAEVRRYAERVIDRFAPTRTDVLVLLPCSARKPYSLSQSHRRFAAAVASRGHEVIVTSPLGVVPRELERVYPAGHYDVPVTGYWDREECAFIADILVRYLAKNAYGRVIAHLEGGALTVAEMAAEALSLDLEVTCSGHPTSGASLRALDEALRGERKMQADMVRGTLAWQFGTDVDMKGLRVRSKGPRVSVLRGKQQVFSIDPGTGLFRPTFEGWQLIPDRYRVTIDDFVPQGDVLAPGVVAADPAIREGDEVLVQGERALATGKAMMGADEMVQAKRGVAVKVRKVRTLE
ncbi:pseudouridine synthase [Methanoculleus sp. FWC-SCC1]|uniref:Pseudouridine synthase n=1 Tax=Methanoculleus frigidifontis TaxID=2584085 RepID=A0ABT8M6B5_9EURY|nr:archaeosine synthase subunit alpha [Methanoculleus sp. FWC-SCC1]MDN7023450.1 pseudouridine synthase [Methanoculleus sp. FWC-SCC1]